MVCPPQPSPAGKAGGNGAKLLEAKWRTLNNDDNDNNDNNNKIMIIPNININNNKIIHIINKTIITKTGWQWGKAP